MSPDEPEFKVGDTVVLQSKLFYPEAKIIAVEEDDGVPYYTIQIVVGAYDQNLMKSDPE